MKFSLSWLKDHLDTRASLAKITETLTAIGLEVESVSDRSAELAPFRVAKIIEAKQHPNADRLKLCTVDTGKETLQIVCGAANARDGLKVVLAPVGTTIPASGMVIRNAKIRDVESSGMLCSASELGLSEESQGIIELPEEAKVGAPFAPLYGLDDPIIEIAVTPNRADCLGVRGIARDLAAAGLGTFTKLSVETASVKEKLKKGTFRPEITVSIHTDKCTFFIGRLIRGVRNGPSPLWLQNRLRAIGLKPISALVDITTYLTFDLGRPAHVYDAAKLQGNLTVRNAGKGEKLLALNDKEYALEEGMAVIADDSGPVALGGIIGGKATGCTEHTTDVFLEIALFDTIAVASTGRTLQIDSDARHRFERGVDPAFLKQGAEMATAMILEFCSGEASEPIIAGKEPNWERSIALRETHIAELTGVTPAKAETKRILKALGFTTQKTAKGWKVSVPSWRSDITQEADLVEEIIRIHGYDKIPALPVPFVFAQQILSPRQQCVRETRHILATKGLKEIISYSFLSSELLKLFNIYKVSLELSNPISADLDALRSAILPNLLEALRKNAARGYYDLALFEIGPVFMEAKPGAQQQVAAGIRSGMALPRNPHEPARMSDVFDAKADALAAVSTFINPENLCVEQGAYASYHPGRSGTLKLGTAVIGYFGDVHPAILQKMGLQLPVSAFEIFLDALPEPQRKQNAARPALALSNYQAVERDFAFVVDASTSAADILAAVKQADKGLIESVTLFDIYAGKGVEQGKKSVAFSVRLQPCDRTLTDVEIETTSAAIISAVTKTTGGRLRE